MPREIKRPVNWLWRTGILVAAEKVGGGFLDAITQRWLHDSTGDQIATDDFNLLHTCTWKRARKIKSIRLHPQRKTQQSNWWDELCCLLDELRFVVERLSLFGCSSYSTGLIRWNINFNWWRRFSFVYHSSCRNQLWNFHLPDLISICWHKVTWHAPHESARRHRA